MATRPSSELIHGSDLSISVKQFTSSLLLRQLRFLKANLRSFSLKHCLLAVRVDKLEVFGHAVDFECEGSHLVDRLQRKSGKYLLERCLLDPVLVDVHGILAVLNQTEQEPDSFVMSRNSQLVEEATHFKHLHMREDLGEESQELEAIDLHKQVLSQSLHSDLALVSVCLSPQAGANSFFGHLVEDELLHCVFFP